MHLCVHCSISSHFLLPSVTSLLPIMIMWFILHVSCWNVRPLACFAAYWNGQHGVLGCFAAWKSDRDSNGDIIVGDMHHEAMLLTLDIMSRCSFSCDPRSRMHEERMDVSTDLLLRTFKVIQPSHLSFALDFNLSK